MKRAPAVILAAMFVSGCMAVCPPAWSPDGRYVTAVKYTPSGEGLRPRVLIFDMREGEIKQPKFGAPIQAGWGPAELYVCSSEDAGMRIFMLEPPDFEPQEVALPAGDVYWAAPLADGSGICYGRLRPG